MDGGRHAAGQSGSGASLAAAAAAAAPDGRAPPALVASASGGAPAISSSVYSSSSATGAHLEAASILVNPAHFNGHDNGPILYTDSNRTSAIDDIRSIVIYVFIVTIFLCFFLILPGIRNEKLPTFFCITTSLLVGSIIVLSLFGTTWHVGEAPISAAYKAFSRDRIQGDLKVRIGLQSVNISLKAHKYYILHHTDGPVIMENMPATNLLASMTAGSSQPIAAATEAGAGAGAGAGAAATAIRGTSSENEANDFFEYATSDQSTSAAAASFINNQETPASAGAKENESSLAEELLGGRTADGIPVDTELETEEVFASSPDRSGDDGRVPPTRNKRLVRFKNQTTPAASESLIPKYTIKRVHVDINYNERFYWIGPVQMRQEYQQALERGLPYPILTVVEYLSQDDAGFNWSRRYRAAGYYTAMCLWFSASLCILMFCLHCAAPKYGIYAMQLLGCLLLLTNLTYAMLVPSGDQKLVIPFEGQSLTFRFGWNFWLVLVGGCLSLLVGTMFVILDKLFPNFIFTTVLDADFDSQQSYYHRKHKTILYGNRSDEDLDASSATNEKPKFPPFMRGKSSLGGSNMTNSTVNSNKLNQKSQIILRELDDSQQSNGGEQSYETINPNADLDVPTSENTKQSNGETLRRRFEHQVALTNRSHQLASTSFKAIDYRDLDSRGASQRELTIRL